MKKTLLIMLIALCAVSFVFAEGNADEQKKNYGKIAVGVKTGYVPAYKMGKFDVTGKWQMDFEAIEPFTTDFVAEIGYMTDFKDSHAFDAYMGAGLTKEIGEDWDVYANVGLDMLFNKDFCDLGLAGNVGVEFYPTEHVGVSTNVKVVEYFKTKQLLFEPSLGVNYAF